MKVTLPSWMMLSENCPLRPIEVRITNCSLLNGWNPLIRLTSIKPSSRSRAGDV